MLRALMAFGSCWGFGKRSVLLLLSSLWRARYVIFRRGGMGWEKWRTEFDKG